MLHVDVAASRLSLCITLQRGRERLEVDSGDEGLGFCAADALFSGADAGILQLSGFSIVAIIEVTVLNREWVSVLGIILCKKFISYKTYRDRTAVGICNLLQSRARRYAKGIGSSDHGKGQQSCSH